MKKIKVISMTVSKSDMFETRVNEFLKTLENDESVTDYKVDFLLSDEALLAVITIDYN